MWAVFADRRIAQWSFVALAMACVIPLYWATLSFDLFGDDYFFLRPYRTEHLWSVLTGPWMGAQATPFYRPIAVFAYKAMVYVFGLNTPVLHAIPLVTMVLMAWLTGVFVRRETGSMVAGATAVVIASIHPLSTVAVGPWISNQYQGWITVLLLCVLIGWQNLRTLPWRMWNPLWLACIIAALIKEPGLMLPLMLVGYHAARAIWLRDLAAPSRGVVLSALGVFLGVNAWRMYVLGGIGGYSDLPSSPLRNLLKSPYFAFVQPTHPLAGLPWSVGFGVLSVGIACLALWSLARRRDHPENRLVLAGLVILCGAAIPTMNVISADRSVPHQLGAILILTGGAWALTRLVRSRVVIASLAVATLATTLPLTHAAINTFNPCEGRLLEQTDILPFRVAPPEMIRWQAQQTQPCDPATQVPFYRSTVRITWGVHEDGAPDKDLPDQDRVYRWTSPNVRIFLDQRAVAARVVLRHSDASPTNPIAVEVLTNRTPARWITLTSPDWQEVVVPLHPTWNVWTRQMHRLELIASPDAVAGLVMRPLAPIYASVE